MHDGRPVPSPFSMLDALHGDRVTASIFSERGLVQSWLDTEAALARAQAATGLIDSTDADAIAAAAVMENIDLSRLWDEAANVGYPILPLVRMVAAALSDGPNGRVHYGATTQDIMDTGLALQLSAALDRFHDLLDGFGDGLAELMVDHQDTVLAARTHAQQAVPTTFGAKLAVYLAEVGRHWERLVQARPRICVVSLFGAGGTSAAMGDAAARVRDLMADDLGLETTAVPWHVARDGLAEFGHICASLAATCGRFGREVIDLARTEIREVAEAEGHHRGASSTMPQKANPIDSEALVGFAVTAGALCSSMYRAMEAGHERAAGEWQAEWHVVPHLAAMAGSALRVAGSLAGSLRVLPDAMRANLSADHGLIMAEAYMMRLAPKFGREHAHDLVYAAAHAARREGGSLEDMLAAEIATAHGAAPDAVQLLPDDYVGRPELVCQAARSVWHSRARLPPARKAHA